MPLPLWASRKPVKVDISHGRCSSFGVSGALTVAYLAWSGAGGGLPPDWPAAGAVARSPDPYTRALRATGRCTKRASTCPCRALTCSSSVVSTTTATRGRPWWISTVRALSLGLAQAPWTGTPAVADGRTSVPSRRRPGDPGAASAREIGDQLWSQWGSPSRILDWAPAPPASGPRFGLRTGFCGLR